MRAVSLLLSPLCTRQRAVGLSGRPVRFIVPLRGRRRTDISRGDFAEALRIARSAVVVDNRGRGHASHRG